MPRESLRQEQIPRGSVDVRDRRMAQRVEGIEPVDSRPHLPGPEGELDASGRDAGAALVAEERVLGAYPFTSRTLVPPEPPELDQQGIRQEHVADAAVLGNLGPEADAVLRPAIRRVDIPDVQTYNLGQPEAGSQGQRVDQVVPGVVARGAKQRKLFPLGQG